MGTNLVLYQGTIAGSKASVAITGLTGMGRQRLQKSKECQIRQKFKVLYMYDVYSWHLFNNNIIPTVHKITAGHRSISDQINYQMTLQNN